MRDSSSASLGPSRVNAAVGMLLRVMDSLTLLTQVWSNERLGQKTTGFEAISGLPLGLKRDSLQWDCMENLTGTGNQQILGLGKPF